MFFRLAILIPWEVDHILRKSRDVSILKTLRNCAPTSTCAVSFRCSTIRKDPMVQIFYEQMEKIKAAFFRPQLSSISDVSFPAKTRSDATVPEIEVLSVISTGAPSMLIKKRNDPARSRY